MNAVFPISGYTATNYAIDLSSYATRFANDRDGYWRRHEWEEYERAVERASYRGAHGARRPPPCSLEISAELFQLHDRVHALSRVARRAPLRCVVRMPWLLRLPRARRFRRARRRHKRCLRFAR